MLCLPIVNIKQPIKIVIKCLNNGIKPDCVASQKLWKKTQKISGILDLPEVSVSTLQYFCKGT